MRLKFRPYAVVMGAAGLGLLALSVGAQGTQTIEIVVEGSRPMADALDQIEARLGHVITYEDPQWAFTGDLIPSARSATVLVPKGGRFRFKLPVPGEAGNTSLTEHAVQSAIVDFDAGGLGTTFRLARTEGMIHVIPSTARDGAGRVSRIAPVLDERISVEDAPRTAWEMLMHLRNSSGGRLLLGRITPEFLLKKTKLLGGAHNESMRDILVRTLAATDPALSYRVFCAPFQGSMACALNVHVVESIRAAYPLDYQKLAQ